MAQKNLWIVRSFIIHNRFFLYPFIFSFVHLKRRLKWRAIIKVDLPVGMVFPLLPNLSFPCVTWCGAAICKQKIRRATACKKVVWYNYVEQNDIQKNSLQKENEFVIQFPKKGTKCEKWLCMKLTLAACKNKWSNLQTCKNMIENENLQQKITVNKYLQQNWFHTTICKKLSSPTIGKRWIQTYLGKHRWLLTWERFNHSLLLIYQILYFTNYRTFFCLDFAIFFNLTVVLIAHSSCWPAWNEHFRITPQFPSNLY